MSRRVWIILGGVTVLALAIWLVVAEEPAEEPVETVRRSATERAAPPRLIGTGDAGAATEEGPAGSDDVAAPSRPWETRPGFDVGKDGGVRAFGRILAPNGVPVEGALVWKTYAYRPFFRAQAEAGHNDFFVAAAKTDAEGRYRFGKKQIRGSLPGHVILARHEDQAAILLKPNKGEAPQELPDLVLGPAMVIRIDVVNAHGESVEGANAELRIKYDGTGIADLLLGDVSDEFGHVSFLAFPDGPKLALDLHLVAAGYPDIEQELNMAIVRRGETIRVELMTGMTIRGTVVDADGNPPAQALFRVAEYDAEYDRHALLDGPGVWADPAGDFEVHGVPPQNARLLVFYSTTEVTIRPWDLGTLPPQEIVLEDGNHGGVQSVGLVQLGGWSAIEGVVLDPFGNPIERADVRITTAIGGLRGLRVATDESGRFETEDLPACRYHVRVSHEFPDVGERKAEVESVHPGAPPLTIQLTGAATLVMRFHPAGRPRERLETKSVFMQLVGADSAAGAAGSRPFHLIRHKMEPGTWTLIVEVDGHRETTVGPFEIHADRETVIDVAFVPE